MSQQLDDTCHAQNVLVNSTSQCELLFTRTFWGWVGGKGREWQNPRPKTKGTKLIITSQADVAETSIFAGELLSAETQQ